MTSAAERLSALKAKLEKGRGENLKAVEEEGDRRPALTTSAHAANEVASSDEERAGSVAQEGRGGKRRARKRLKVLGAAVDVGSADEADGEDEDARLRSMKRRARNMSQQGADAFAENGSNGAIITYGVTGHALKEENMDRMVSELKQVDKRREKFRRRRAFHEDRSDITFINEGNRLFNRTLDKHFDKFESVKKIKDSLERGTA